MWRESYVSTAQALPIVNFDFTGTGGMGPGGNPHGLPQGWLMTDEITFSVDGLELTITGTDSGLPGSSADLFRTPLGGFGVDDPQGLSNVGADESLIFDFSPERVFELSALVVEVGNQATGTLEVIIDDTITESISWISGGAAVVAHNFAQTFSGSKFEFRPTGPQGNPFRIAGLTVEVVPEPTSVALMSLGLLGFGMRSIKDRRFKHVFHG